MVQAGPGRPKGYFLPDGTRVPGVTTIIGRFKDSGALMHWAWLQGMNKKDYRDTSGAAAAAGTFAHAMIEADILSKEFVWPTAEQLQLEGFAHDELVRRATSAFSAYREWRAGSNVEIVQTELPLVSERLKYGGTIDAVALVNGNFRILDWKGTGRIYPDHLVQVAAYRALWNEAFPEREIDGSNLLRVDKEFAAFDYAFWPKAVVDLGEQAFGLMRQLYDVDKQIKKAIGR